MSRTVKLIGVLFFCLATILLSLSAHSANGELTWKNVQGYKYKHWSTVLVTKVNFTNSEMYHSFHYDSEKKLLIKCSVSGQYSDCSAMKGSISEYPFIKTIEQKNGWKWVGTFMLNPSYHLHSTNPFMQLNEFSFYLSDKGPNFCRRTHTSYNFTYTKKEKYLVFTSKKQDNTEHVCKPMSWEN